MDLGLKQSACVVTGASRGIGLATARALAAEGARVLLVARDEQRLAEAAASCDGAEWLSLDVTVPDAGERVVAECERRFGGIDVLVNNAGTATIRSIDELADADWYAQWEIHVMAPMRLMRAAAPRMAERGRGRIVNVTSASGKRPSQRYADYSVSKAAQLSLSRTFADAWAARGVLVNAVAPGPLDGSLWRREGGLADQIAERQGTTADEAIADAAAKIPLGRMGTEEEAAAVICFLCSELASNVAGAAWSVDGGAVAQII
ncbi:MAG TPA: SDR family oxidoreductase [Thermoleophilaceae bacterium]|nr:SDR family oxidoreductase [Thermoleophilaceae bacterium]